MKEKRKRNANPRPYRQGLDAMFTARIPRSELLEIRALCKRTGLTPLDIVRRGRNLAESEE